MRELYYYPITTFTLEAKNRGVSLHAGRGKDGGRHPLDGDPRQRLITAARHISAAKSHP
uniref:Uncharacterized protein n=1 Tax=Arundo donax TaxID=35708 RepID=A0A0A9CKH0_ARUDO